MSDNTPNAGGENPEKISAPKIKTSPLPFNIFHPWALSEWRQKKIIYLLDRGGLTEKELENEHEQLTGQGILWPDDKVIVSE